MSNFDLDSFFNETTLDNMDFKKSEKRPKVLYSPSCSDEKCVDNTYKAIIRFIQNPANTEKNILQKYCYWLDFPELGVRGYYDSPQSVGRECLLYSTRSKLYNLSKNGDAKAKKNYGLLSRKEQYHSLVYIVKDVQHKELEGTVMIFRYNRTIKDLIDKQRYPSQEEIELNGAESVNVFSLWEGKDFLLEISKQGEYPSYDGCKFANNKSAIKINGEFMNKTNKAHRAILKEVLIDNCPDLLQYDYQEPTIEQLEQIKKVVNFVTIGKDLDIINKSQTKSTEVEKPNKTVKKEQPKKIEIEEDEDDEDFTYNNTSSSVNDSSEDEDEDLESFLKNI